MVAILAFAHCTEANGCYAGRCDLRLPLAMQRLLIILGLIILAVGLLWPWIAKLGLGRLPGDIRIERDGFGFYFPLTTGIIISIVITLILWIFRR